MHHESYTVAVAGWEVKMKIDRTFELPFPWCKRCTAFDPEYDEFYFGMTGERKWVCKNSEICTKAVISRDYYEEGKNGNKTL